MNPRTVLKTALPFVLAGAFLYIAFGNADLGALWEMILSADPFWVAMLVPIGLLSHWVRAVRWRYLLRPVRPGLGLRNLFSAVMVGYAVNNVVPRVGELVRAVYIGRLEGVSRSAALGTVIVERMLDFVTFAVVVTLTLFIAPSALDPFVEDAAGLRPVLLVGAAAATVVLTTLFLRLDWFAALIERFRQRIPGPVSDRAGRLLASLRTGLSVTHLGETWPWVVFWSVVMWGLYGAGLYVSFFLYPEVADLGLGFGAAMVLLVVSTIAWLLPAPGAMGTYHSFLPAALAGLYGVGATPALGMTVITHELGFIMVMIIGTWFYIADHARVGSLRSMDIAREGTVS